MNKFAIGFFCATMFLCTPSANADPLGGQVDKFADLFNSKAKSAKSSLRVAKASCGSDVRKSCKYVLTNNITLIATSMEDKKTLGDLSIHMDGTPRDAVIYLALLDALMAMYAPNASGDERRVVLAQLLQQLGKERVPKVELDGLVVSVLLIPGVASLTAVNRGDIGLDASVEEPK